MEEPNRTDEKWTHRARMEKVWQKKAPIYDRWVTRTNNRILKKYIAREQELLNEYLRWVAARNSERKISILEIGSGTGRTLLDLMNKPEITCRIQYLVGIDKADAMYNISKYKLSQAASALNHVKNGSAVFSKYVFLNLSAERLSRYFDRGHVDINKLELEIAKEPIGTINEKEYNESLKVVINMLNTLGVIRDTRPIVLRNMVRAAGPGGKIVVSVFNGNFFDRNAKPIYESIRNIVGKFDEDDFNYAKNEFSTQWYFSHWFSRSEIEGLMRKAGCSNIRTTEIDNIGLFVTGEVSR